MSYLGPQLKTHWLELQRYLPKAGANKHFLRGWLSECTWMCTAYAMLKWIIYTNLKWIPVFKQCLLHFKLKLATYHGGMVRSFIGDGTYLSILQAAWNEVTASLGDHHAQGCCFVLKVYQDSFVNKVWLQFWYPSIFKGYHIDIWPSPTKKKLQAQVTTFKNGTWYWGGYPP